MSRQFTVPVAVALSFHAFLFLGFTKDPSLKPSPKKADTEPPRIIVNFPPPQEDEPVSIDTPPSGLKAATAAPTLPEPISDKVPINVITERVPPSVPNTLPSTIASIPVGNPNGNNVGLEGNDRNIINLASLDNPPRTRFQVSPPYPAAMRAAGIKGEVTVEFVVNEDGRVGSAHVVSSNHPEFEDTTLRAVRQWRFEPGKRNGRPVRFRMSVPIVFNLTDDDR